MIKTPLSTMVGGAFWTPEATVIGGGALNFEKLVAKLFANNEQGFFYDPNDLSTMFQDAAGTIPVTAVGQPVGLILDKSGRNNHAYQTASASRPILRKNAVTGANYLEFDGSDDSLLTNNIDFTATDKMSLFVGVRKLGGATVNMVCEFSTRVGSINNGSFYLAAPADSAYPSQITFANQGTKLSTSKNPDLPSPISVVVTCRGDIVADSTIIRTNGAQFSSAGDLGTGNYGNYPLYIGRRANAVFPFSGHVYSLIGVGKLVSDDETLTIEKELAKRVGVTLNV